MAVNTQKYFSRFTFKKRLAKVLASCSSKHARIQVSITELRVANPENLVGLITQYFVGYMQKIKNRHKLLNKDTLSQIDRESLSTDIPGQYSLKQYYRIKEKLKGLSIKSSTRKAYYNRWKALNKFLLKFDTIPETWEDRVILYITHLVDNKRKSSTVKSYLSAIRFILNEDNVKLNEDKVELAALLRACKLQNDTLYIRLPIQYRLFRSILRKITSWLDEEKGQTYLAKLLRAAFSMAYFGLMRVSELTKGQHQLRASNVRFSKEKNKYVLFLHSSKTHTENDFPQKIEIHAVPHMGRDCPVQCIKEYVLMRGNHSDSDLEPFFQFQGGAAFTSVQFRNNLRIILRQIGVDDQLYDTHSYRCGRCTDLQEMGFSIDDICLIGRWSPKSSTILTYIRKL